MSSLSNYSSFSFICLLLLLSFDTTDDKMRLFNRRRESDDTVVANTASDVPATELSKKQVKRATRTRKSWALLTSFFLLVALVFLILVEIAGTSNKDIIKNWYFLKLDLSDVVPSSVPNFALINTIAQTLGLHDFYQVGLWGFCEGYQGEGVTFCSKPQTLYWFNPVEILRNELLAGASSKSIHLHNTFIPFLYHHDNRTRALDTNDMF